MPSSGYFDQIFANSGTTATIPDTTQSNGSVSYQQGYGPYYTLANTNPNYLPIDQPKFNQLMYDITAAIQLIQQNGCSNFITSAMNGGTAYSYNQGATVLQSGIVYFSLVGSNTTTPPSSSWAPLSLSSIVYAGGTTAGTVNAQTTAVSNFVLAEGVTVFAPFGLANTNAWMLNVAGTGAIAVKKQSPSGLIACIGGESAVGNMGQFTYDGTVWQFMNPQPVSSASGIQSLIDVKIFTSSGTWTKPTGCNAVEIECVGGGASGSASGLYYAGGDTSFGSVCVAPGGSSGTTAVGNLIIAGQTIASLNGNGSGGMSGRAFGFGGAAGAGGGPGYGGGGGIVTGGGTTTPGLGGQYSYVYMASSSLGSTVSATVGAGGSGSGLPSGSSGLIIVKSYK